MAAGKYIVAAEENSVQVTVRNILNPDGYVFLDRCSDAITLLRMIRSYHPDFIVADVGTQVSDIRATVETVDGEMLCPCILLGEYKDTVIFSMMEKSNAISFCPKPLDRDLLLHTVNMASANFNRVLELKMRLKQMEESYESRKLIDHAKWMLMEREGLSEKNAYEYMRKRSMDERLTMKLLAEKIIGAYRDKKI